MATKRVITYEELNQHQERDNLWLLLRGKVYDVAKFLDEHPGGEEVIVAEAGKDAIESFEDVGHSDEAHEILDTLFIGTFGEPEKLPGARKRTTPINNENENDPSLPPPPPGINILMFILPLACMGAYFAWRFYA